MKENSMEWKGRERSDRDDRQVRTKDGWVRVGVNKVRANGRWCVGVDYFDACRWVLCRIVMCCTLTLSSLIWRAEVWIWFIRRLLADINRQRLAIAWCADVQLHHCDCMSMMICFISPSKSAPFFKKGYRKGSKRLFFFLKYCEV